MTAHHCIVRIVPRGAPAAGWQDEDECDMEAPCDLVMLTGREVDGTTEEIEIKGGRLEFATGHEASKHLCSCLTGWRRP